MKEAAIGIVFNEKKNEVLLIKRRDVPIWVLPSGGIEACESPETACQREVVEETGVPVKVIKKVGTWLPVNKLASNTHLFICAPTGPICALLPQLESQEVRFFPLNALPKTLFFLHKEFVFEALEEKPLPITKKMTSLTYFKAFMLLCKHPIYAIRYIFARLGCPLNS